MPYFFKIVSAVVVVWSTIYTISFAVNEIKEKRAVGGIAVFGLIVLMITAYIKSIGF